MAIPFLFPSILGAAIEGLSGGNQSQDGRFLSMLPSVLKGGLGFGQLLGGIIGGIGNRRPTYQIPKAATMALGQAQQLASRMEMPGESTMYAKAAQQGANALGQAREYGGAGLAMLPGIMAGVQSQNLNIGMKSADWRTQMQQNLMAQMAQYAQYQDQAWQMNKFAPFQDRLRRSQNAIGAGIKNIAGGADSAMMTMLGMPDLWGNKFGFNTNSGSDTDYSESSWHKWMK